MKPPSEREKLVLWTMYTVLNNNETPSKEGFKRNLEYLEELEEDSIHKDALDAAKEILFKYDNYRDFEMKSKTSE